jgi:hypothetical protein
VLEQSEVDQWFSDAQKDKDKKEEPAEKAEKVENLELVDPKRVFNLGIILKKLRMRAEDCRTALMALDTEVLDPERCQMLQGLLPTDDEIRMLLNWKKDPKNKDKLETFGVAVSETFGQVRLGPVSNFLMRLAGIPRLKEKLALLSMKLHLAERQDQLTAVTTIVGKACAEVMNSKAFKKLQLIVINLGNYVNHGTARGNAIGFRVESLDKLERMKSNSPNCKTLLHYVALLARRQFRNVLHLRDELKNVHTASKVSHISITQQMTEITQALRILELENGAIDNGKGVNFYEACSTLQASLKEASGDLEGKVSVMSAKIKEMAEAYGEDVALFDCEKWFMFLVTFVHR